MSSHNYVHSVSGVLCILHPDAVAQEDGGGLQDVADGIALHVDFGRKHQGDREVCP